SYQGRSLAGGLGLLYDESDFPLDDFGQGDVRHTHARTGRNERRSTAVQLSDTLGNQVDQDEWVGDNIGGLIDKIAFHGRAGKSRMRPRLLKQNNVVWQ